MAQHKPIPEIGWDPTEMKPKPSQMLKYVVNDVRGCGMCTGQIVGQQIREPEHQTRGKAVDEAIWPWDRQQEFICSLQLQWVPIGRLVVDQEGKLRFPKAPDSPGLYRLRSRSPIGKMAVYIGESDNLQRRFGNYRNPGPTQQTSLRINAWLKNVLLAQNEVSISVVTQTAWIIDGDERALADFFKKTIRRLFEQWAITADQATDIESLNR